MKETIDFRLPEDWARSELGDWGKSLSSLTRRLQLSTGDTRLINVREKISLELSRGHHIGYSAILRRSYTDTELAAAQLLSFFVTSVFEPAGEECGTVYDESTACPVCGAGRSQVSD